MENYGVIFLAAAFVFLPLAIMAFPLIYVSLDSQKYLPKPQELPSYTDTTENVTIYSKYLGDAATNSHFMASLSDGRTYMVNPEIYGYLPEHGYVQVIIRSSYQTGDIIQDIYSNVTCAKGCWLLDTNKREV